MSGVRNRWVSVESLLGSECLVKIRDYDTIDVMPSSIQFEKME